MTVPNDIHRLTRGIANFYLIEDGAALTLIDAGTPDDWDLLNSAVSQLDIGLDQLEAILITHAHSDHVGFAETARTELNSRVWIHSADEEAATTGAVAKPDGGMGRYVLKPQMYRTMLSLARHGASKIVPVQEVYTFTDGDTIDVPGKPRVIHAPGHTAGSCALYVESRRTVLTGDVLATWNPLTGRAGPQIMPSAMNLDTTQALESVDRLADIPADTLLPGHGDPWSGDPAEAARLVHAAGRS